MDPSDILNKLDCIISSNSPSSPLYFTNTTKPIPAPMTPIPVSIPFPGNSSSTSDEAEEDYQANHQQQLVLVNERKRRRMISNRESARRSRLRKQRHLDELRSQVDWLRDEHRRLSDGLARALEVGDEAARENARLKEEVLILRQMLTDIQLDTTFSSLCDLEDVSCNNGMTRVMAESSE